MKTIRKYPLELTERPQPLWLPIDWYPLHVAVDDGGIAVWMQHDTDKAFESVEFMVLADEQEVPLHGYHVGSVQMQMYDDLDVKDAYHVYTLAEEGGDPNDD